MQLFEFLSIDDIFDSRYYYDVDFGYKTTTRFCQFLTDTEKTLRKMYLLDDSPQGIEDERLVHRVTGSLQCGAVDAELGSVISFLACILIIHK